MLNKLVFAILAVLTILTGSFIYFSLRSQAKIDVTQERVFCMGDMILQDDDIFNDDLSGDVWKEKFKNIRKECNRKYQVK